MNQTKISHHKWAQAEFHPIVYIWAELTISRPDTKKKLHKKNFIFANKF